jgi:hypothetical protein
LIFKFLGKFIFPWLLASGINKMNADKQKKYQDFIKNKKREEGQVSVDFIPPKDKNRSTDEGEYVDYEEVKD